MSIIIDTGETIEAHRQALAKVFGVAIDRVTIGTTVTVDGTTPIIALDLRLDGERAPEAWWRFSADVIEIARLRAEQHKLEAKLAAVPWWRRWLAHLAVRLA